ncbi:MAG: hypothetical protein K2W96_00395 [Gemmataceae bacterium]|nr:hypothetical protein [Gemmataceae bacterium]
MADNLNTHMGLDLCEAAAHLDGVASEPGKLRTMEQRRAFLGMPGRKHVFRHVPRHGSWLNQAELSFSVLSRQFLRRGDFGAVKESEDRLRSCLDEHNREKAHPCRWTYAGEPLQKATPSSQSDKQRKRGRAWSGTRPQLHERLIHPPRPYRRKQPSLATNL